MRFNDLFEGETFRLLKMAQRKAKSQNKPAITSYMAAKEFIENKERMSRAVFNENHLDMDAFHRMADARIREMPTVDQANPFVDDEMDSIVRESARYDGEGHAIAHSVTAEKMLRIIITRHADECREYSRTENTRQGQSQPNNLLERYSTDWTELASRGLIQPVIGRDDQLLALQRSLLRKTKNNPVLTGDAGTGKTAIVEGLAVKIFNGDVHPDLRLKRILSLDVVSLMERSGLGGVKEAMTIASESDNIILFIDEIHALPNGTLDILKPFMGRGELRLIGATTAEEYSKIIECDKAFARRLQRIEIPELSEAETKVVLENIRSRFEQHHGIRIGDDALKAAVELSQRYLTNRHQPDKAIDLMDEATAKVRMEGESGPVNEDDIREVLSKKTGIPLERIGVEETTRLMNLEQTLGAEILGQPEAVTAVSKAVRRNSVGLSSASRPTASFIFVGPSGVGKTALAQALAKTLMGTPDALLRIDMSEYQQPFSVSRLIGSPPGYVGYQSGGQLTEAVSRRPYSVILFDEIEKAHPTVFELFLQVLDYGRMTDGRGRTVDFTNTIIIFTSNLGARDAGCADDSTIREFFTPEFLNRLDGIVHFNKLGKPLLLDIARKMLEELGVELLFKGYHVEFDSSVAEYIVGLDPGMGQGARPIRRAIEQNVTDAIVSLMLSGRLVKGRAAVLTVRDGGLQLQNHRTR